MSASVLVAPDSFKGSVTAAVAAEAIARGWSAARPADRIKLLPQADGGEGTMDAIAAAAPTSTWHHVGLVTGPDGRPTPGKWLELAGGVAVVELAQCSGLPLMASPDPVGATTRGLGEVIAHALDHGAEALVIGLGGSASTDGAAGALAALGAELLDAAGNRVGDGGGALTRLARISWARLRLPPPAGVRLLADVSIPLLGENGTAAVFGGQKGASAGDIRLLDDALRRFSALVGGNPEAPGSGAAGGAGYGFAAAWGAAIEPGARYVQEFSGLSEAIADADLVITGEGRFDGSSSRGKVVGEVLALAAETGTAVAVVAGQLSAPVAGWSAALADIAGSAEEAIANPVPALEEAGARAAAGFSAG